MRATRAPSTSTARSSIPLATPDDLDDVPAGAAEDRLELLDDLAVAAHRAVEALQVAVDDEGQVVEPLAGGHVERAERLRLVGLAVAEEGPDPLLAGVLDAAGVQVAVEAGLVDGGQRAEAHRDGRELPEVGHQPRMRVAREPLAGHDLPAEVVELALAQPALEEGAGVDARRGVALEEDLVAHAGRVLAAEEVVEADFVEAGRALVGRQVAADAGVGVVGAQDHRHRVPADHAPDAQLHALVARERRLLLRADGVDVARLGQRRQADVELARALQQAVEDELGALVAAAGLDDRVERIDPVLGLGWVAVGQLSLEVAVLVEHVEAV